MLGKYINREMRTGERFGGTGMLVKYINREDKDWRRIWVEREGVCWEGVSGAGNVGDTSAVRTPEGNVLVRGVALEINSDS